MNILARLDIGEDSLTREWELDGENLIIQRFGSKAIAIPLDKTRIWFSNLGNFVEQINKAPKQAEYIEAVDDAAKRVYLGTVNITNAIIFPPN